MSESIEGGGEMEVLVRRLVVRALRELGITATPASVDEDELLSQAEAAALARCSVSTIREWQRRGILKRYGQGRASLVKRSELFAPKAQAARASDDAALDARADAILKGGRRG
ncbi:helix-turn-helix domain-containing protein [Corallococcus sp. 4LFB]|uniref:helix-turn-helix domain-containing protein n=1 Tax=Corallococcus sp. 4LFB TaxID=3383249 RepID=UPI003976817B